MKPRLGRVRSFEFLPSGIMVTFYRAVRPDEIGKVTIIPIGPVKPKRPTSAAPS